MKLSSLKEKSEIFVRRNKVVGSGLRKLGPFYEVPRPAFADSLKFPEDVTKLDAMNVSELHGKYTMMYAYANQELAKANVALLRLHSRVALRRNTVFRSRPTLNSQERWRRDAILDSDSDMEIIEAQITSVKMEKTWAEMFVANFERYLTALSRELSRKTAVNTAKL